MDDKRALIVGASRGLGLGLARELLARGWQVVGTVRGPTEGADALHSAHRDRFSIETVDINQSAQVQDLRRQLQSTQFDLLFINAGVLGSADKTISDVSHEEFVHVMTTNAFSPVRLADALLGLVQPAGTVAFMSSQLGSITNNSSGRYEVYRASKAALNMLVRSFVSRLPDNRLTVLLLHPGWVRTDMGGATADIDVATSTRGLADAIEARGGSGGVDFLDYRGRTLPW